MIGTIEEVKRIHQEAEISTRNSGENQLKLHPTLDGANL